MELSNLVGRHLLSGLDETTIPGRYDNANAVLFILDDITYKAIEDPSDGYRSYMDDISVTEEKVSNKFPPQEVDVKMKNDPNDDILQFFDVQNGKLVLEIGTDNSCDYYPYCVLNWYPQNLSINE